MIFTPLGLAGAHRVELERREDERGFFARLFCAREFTAHGLETSWVQINTSLSRKPGTLRGMHFQRPPFAEAKLVRCIRGAIMDVIVDLRAGSSSFGKWLSLDLSDKNRSMIYVPKGFAHGFQTLEANTELLYFHSAPYSSEHEGGLHHADSTVGITWPLPVADLSKRDEMHPGLSAVEPIAI